MADQADPKDSAKAEKAKAAQDKKDAKAEADAEAAQKPRSDTDRRKGAERRAPEPTAYTPELRTAKTERRSAGPSFSNVGIERRMATSPRRKS